MDTRGHRDTDLANTPHTGVHTQMHVHTYTGTRTVLHTHIGFISIYAHTPHTYTHTDARAYTDTKTVSHTHTGHTSMYTHDCPLPHTHMCSLPSSEPLPVSPLSLYPGGGTFTWCWLAQGPFPEGRCDCGQVRGSVCCFGGNCALQSASDPQFPANTSCMGTQHVPGREAVPAGAPVPGWVAGPSAPGHT